MLCLFGGDKRVDYIRNCLNMFGLLIDLVGVRVCRDRKEELKSIVQRGRKKKVGGN